MLTVMRHTADGRARGVRAVVLVATALLLGTTSCSSENPDDRALDSSDPDATPAATADYFDLALPKEVGDLRFGLFSGLETNGVLHFTAGCPDADRFVTASGLPPAEAAKPPNYLTTIATRYGWSLDREVRASEDGNQAGPYRAVAISEVDGGDCEILFAGFR